MSEPVRKSYSLDELRWSALNYMRLEYGLPAKDDQEARDRWHERLGLLTVFVATLWELPPEQHGDGR